MFSLSPAGRHNLEAICVELERAARQHPALFHQQLKPWSVKGEVRITEPQWEAFIENEGQCLSEEVWCDWDGPFDDYLGIWHGSPDGLEEFCNLAESLGMVLCREDFSEIDSRDLPIEFESVHEWLMTLHQWAMRFSLPLLRGYGELWNGETDDPNEYNRLIQIWGSVGDVSYPMHPLIFNLQFNVWSSSLAAVRALLSPELVVATNTIWPLSDAEALVRKRTTKGEKPEVAGQERQERCDVHRIVEGPKKWSVLPAGMEFPFTPSKNSGLQRIAAYIANQHRKLPPAEAIEYGKRPISNPGRAVWRTADGKAEQLEHNRYRKQSKDTPEGRRQVEEQFRSISEELELARKNSDHAAISRCQVELEALVKEFNIDKKGNVRKQRGFRDMNEKRQKDAIATTIRDTLQELRDNGLPYIAEELNEQLDIAKLEFHAKDHLPQWEIVRLQ
jgi:hypothetical protein